MDPIGAAILFICFLGPVMPPLIGFVVGSLHDLLTRRGESMDVQARRRISEAARSAEA